MRSCTPIALIYSAPTHESSGVLAGDATTTMAAGVSAGSETDSRETAAVSDGWLSCCCPPALAVTRIRVQAGEEGVQCEVRWSGDEGVRRCGSGREGSSLGGAQTDDGSCAAQAIAALHCTAPHWQLNVRTRCSLVCLPSLFTATSTLSRNAAHRHSAPLTPPPFERRSPEGSTSDPDFRPCPTASRTRLVV